MFVLTTNLTDRDLSPFSLAGGGLVCCLSTTAPTPPHTRTLQSYRFMVSGGPGAPGEGREEAGSEVWAWGKGGKEIGGTGGWDGQEQTSNRERNEEGNVCACVSGSGQTPAATLPTLRVHTCVHTHVAESPSWASTEAGEILSHHYSKPSLP